MSLTAPEDATLREILLVGVEIRRLTAAAPFFGPRAPEATQQEAWRGLDDARERFSSALDRLCAQTPEVRPMLMLEAEGCGELCYNALVALGSRAAAEVGVAPLSPEEMEVVERERGVLASRWAAISGQADPEHGLTRTR